MTRVLVTDLEKRKSLPIVRALGRSGIQVTGVESTRFALSFFSRYCTRRVISPSPVTQPHHYLECIKTFLGRHHHDAVFPLEDETMLLMAKYKDEIAPLTNLPVPDFETIMKARDKAVTLNIAKKLGIPHPKTYLVRDGTEAEALKNDLEYPVVIKPRMSSGSRGVVYVKSKSDFVASYTRIHDKYPCPLVQDYIPPGGTPLGVAVLFDNESNLKAVFSYKRLREFPVSGGPSTLRESIRHPEVEKMSIKLLKAIRWYGVAMVEYRVDPRDGQPKLMEINPRFWGSVELPIVAGVNFPCLLLRLAMGEQFDPVTDYRVGVRCRWLLPGDIFHFLSNPDRFKMNPDFFRFFDRDTMYDILSLDDPGPIAGFLVIAVRYLLSREKWGHVFRR